jgi:hypothetical protein
MIWRHRCKGRERNLVSAKCGLEGGGVFVVQNESFDAILAQLDALRL